MEILRFEDAEKSAPNRKKSARGMFIVGLVATLFGVGTAFASTTITINSDQPIDVGQGVSAVSACDDNIKINVNNSLNVNGSGQVSDETGTVLKGTNAKPKFTTTGIVLSDIDSHPFDTSTAIGCGGEVLELQIYQKVGNGTEAIQQGITCGILGLSSGTTLLKYNDEHETSTSSTVNCDNRKITFIVPTTNSPTSSWLIPLKVSVGNSPLDISYFTLISRSAS